MNNYTIITAVVVLGTVLGGFIFFMIKAYKYEKLKNKNGKD